MRFKAFLIFKRGVALYGLYDYKQMLVSSYAVTSANSMIAALNGHAFIW